MTKFGKMTQVVEKHVSMGSAMSHSKEQGSRVPQNFGNFPTWCDSRQTERRGCFRYEWHKRLPCGLVCLSFDIGTWSTTLPSRAGNTFSALRPLTFPAGKKFATTNHVPSRDLDRPIPISRLDFHTSCVKWPPQTDEKLYLLDSTMENLFRKMRSPDHCLHSLLPPDRPLSNICRTRGCDFELPRCSHYLHKQPFVFNCLFKFIDMRTCFYICMSCRR